MSFLKFDVSVETWVIRHGDPDDEWDNDSTDGIVEVTEYNLVKEDGYHVLETAFDVAPGDSVWLVWAQYSTGDSFGSYGAQYELCGVFNDEIEAGIEAERLESVDDYSVPWKGYFESLDFIKVQHMTVDA